MVRLFVSVSRCLGIWELSSPSCLYSQLPRGAAWGNSHHLTILSLSGEATWPAGSIIFFLSRLPCGTVSRGWPSFCKKTPSLSVDFHYNYCHCCCAFLIPLLFAINKLWSQIKVCFCSSLARGGSGKECLIWSLFSAWCLKHYTIKRFNSLIICAVSNHSGLSPLREKYSSRRSW